MNIHTSLFKKPLATLAVIGAIGVTAGLTSVASAQVAGNSSTGGTPTNQASPMGERGHRGPGIMGTVSAVNGTTLTVAGKDGTTYTVDASSATFHKGSSQGTTPTTVTIKDIAVGDTVGIRGTVSGTSIVATDVMDGVPPMGGMGMGRGGMGHGVRGTVSAVNGTTITVKNSDGTSYTVDASGAEISKVSTVPLSDIHVGDTIGAAGSISGTSVTAKHIMTGDFPKDK